MAIDKVKLSDIIVLLYCLLTKQNKTDVWKSKQCLTSTSHKLSSAT